MLHLSNVLHFTPNRFADENIRGIVIVHSIRFRPATKAGRFEQREVIRYRLAYGSAASRIPSPTTLKAKTATTTFL